jgi:DNA repair protein RadC
MIPSSGEGQPRERLRESGPDALSNTELLALLLRTGASGVPSTALAAELLTRFGTLARLAGAGDAELLSVRGVGPAKVAALRAAFEVGCRVAREPLQLGARVRSPAHVHAEFGPRLRGLRQEVFFVVLLDSRHRVLRSLEVSRGSLNQSLVHPREVFGPAIRESAAAILVVHNHPSGDPTPSREDREVTHRLAEAGTLLGVPLLDHVVVAAGGFQSFADRGLLGQGVERTGR